MKKFLLIFTLVLCFLTCFSCTSKETEKPAEEETEEREVDLDFSYLYDVGDFTFDVTPYIKDENTIILPDMTGFTIGQVKYVLDNLGATYELDFDHSAVRSEEDYNKFVGYSHDLKAGDEVSKEKFFYAYTTELPLTHSVVNEVTLDLERAIDSNFIDDGIGLAKLVRNIDGDTAVFIDLKTNKEVKVRFYAIDTPESTIDHDPWGKAASTFTANILSNASVIVLEREPNHVKGTYGRYLAYVWADGILVNLLLVENAYTNAAANDSKYRVYFTEASLHALKTGRRYYGEKDPGYDYELGDFK